MKIKSNKWKPVNLEGPINADDLNGLVGIEELHDYDLNSFDKKTKTKKRKNSEPDKPNKKIKTVKESPKLNRKKTVVKKSKKFKTSVKKKTEIGETIYKEHTEDKCTLDDLTSWNIVPLPDTLLQGLADLKFTTPTAIQELTLPPAIYGRRDILGAAETGSGKTLAFGLPILTGILKLKEEDKNNENNENQDDNLSESEVEEEIEHINENETGCVRAIDNIKLEITTVKPLKKLYALILTPTRELAIQIKNHLIAVAKHTDIKIAVVLGGMAAVKQERILSKGPEIVVATPGRLWELIQEGNPHLSQVDDIRYFAIDETDRMLEKFHFQELHQLLERINMNEDKKKRRQNFVFSATLTMVHDLPRYLLNKKKIKNTSKIHKLTPDEKLQNIINMLGITNPKIVDVTEKSGTAKSLTECKISCALEEKDYYVYYFLQKHPGRTLIFCNSIDCVKRLANLLTILGCSSLPLHANMQQRQRLKNLERFRDNPLGILVATDVAARGLDIPSVEHVLHYQTPRTSESYVHRSGRTARASKEGITVLLIEPKEVNTYVKLCNTLGRTEDLPSFPILENFLTAVKQRVSLARKLELLELQQKRTTARTGWLQKAAKDMDIILDEDEFSMEVDTEEAAKMKRKIAGARQELRFLLSKPIFPKGFSVNYPTSSGQLDIPLVQGDQHLQKAVDVMKNHLENIPKKKKGLQFKRVFKKNDAVKEKKMMKQEKKDFRKKRNKNNKV